MKVTIQLEDGTTKTIEDITLAEQTRSQVYTEDETQSDNDSQRFPNAEIKSARDFVTAGYVKDGTEHASGIKNATYAEQRGDDIYVEGNDETYTIEDAEFDRAYNY